MKAVINLKKPLSLYRLKYRIMSDKNIKAIPAKDTYIFNKAGDNVDHSPFPSCIIT